MGWLRKVLDHQTRDHTTQPRAEHRRNGVGERRAGRKSLHDPSKNEVGKAVSVRKPDHHQGLRHRGGDHHGPPSDMIRESATDEQCGQHAKRVHVSGGGDRVAGHLFGRSEIRGERAHALRGERGTIGSTRVEKLGDAEVEQLYRAIGRHEDVRRLDVAMHDQIRVCAPEQQRQPDADAEADGPPAGRRQ